MFMTEGAFVFGLFFVGFLVLVAGDGLRTSAPHSAGLQSKDARSKKTFTGIRSPIRTAGSRTPTVPRRSNIVRQELSLHAQHSRPASGARTRSSSASPTAFYRTVGTPQVGGKYYFYTRREGTQNQPVLLVREGIQGKDRALVDVNGGGRHGGARLVGPSEDGKYVAYGTSPGGSEESTLPSSKPRPESCCRTPSIGLATPTWPGKKTTPVFTTDALRRKATCPRAKRFITSRFSITRWERSGKRSADFRRASRRAGCPRGAACRR